MDIHITTLHKLCTVCVRAAESKKTIKNVSEYSNILYRRYSVDIDS